MVSLQSVEKQFKKLKFNMHSWGRSEARELPNILMEDEEIYEAVNGIYDGGFALLVATDIRVLLVDKKPLNYLTVEDFRFDMINEIDYNHRLFGAHINLSAGGKNLKFTSYNQPRLRKLISHIQHCIADGKKQQNNQAEDQKNHLEQINQQLQSYLLAQHKHQQELEQHLSGKAGKKDTSPVPDPVKPSPELSDFLYAQSLLTQHEADKAKKEYEAISGEHPAQLDLPAEPAHVQAPKKVEALPAVSEAETQKAAQPQLAELYAEGMQEVFGDKKAPTDSEQVVRSRTGVLDPIKVAQSVFHTRKFRRAQRQSDPQ